jgi:hypothetical protein
VLDATFCPADDGWCRAGQKRLMLAIPLLERLNDIL